jgi:two-component system, cell cycle sensor histidine kinase and response regulator CckA
VAYLNHAENIGCANSNAEIELAATASVNAQQALVDVSAESGESTKSETVLLVEDEAFVREATADTLQSAGYRVIIAGNAMQALERPSNHAQPVDLLLADIVMPGMSGRELAERFKALYPDSRVLLMSGYAEELSVSKRSLHCDSQLSKPFSAKTLLRKVREVLDKNPITSRTQRGVPISNQLGRRFLRVPSK